MIISHMLTLWIFSQVLHFFVTSLPAQTSTSSMNLMAYETTDEDRVSTTSNPTFRLVDTFIIPFDMSYVAFSVVHLPPSLLP